MQRGNVFPAPVPTSQQNRERVSDANRRQRSLVKKKLSKDTLRGTRRHNRSMSGLTQDSHNIGVHDSGIHEDLGNEFGAAQQAYQKSAAAKLLKRRQSASVDPIERSTTYKQKQQSKIQKPNLKSRVIFSRKPEENN